MQKEELTTLFDQQAAHYDDQWRRMAPVNEALHLLTGAVLAGLPARAEILCVGAGTGAEILALARQFPTWRFTAVEPSTAMLEVFRRRAEEQGILSRCECHAGYLDSLPAGRSFDAATAFLVSQFILDRAERTAFFQSMADRLQPGGLLVSSDLAGSLDTAEGQSLLETWFEFMKSHATLPGPEGLARMREAYRRDVGVLSPGEVREILTGAGLERPVPFFQAGLIHAWYSRKPG